MFCFAESEHVGRKPKFLYPPRKDGEEVLLHDRTQTGKSCLDSPHHRMQRRDIFQGKNFVTPFGMIFAQFDGFGS